MNETRRQFIAQSIGVMCGGGLLSLASAKTPEVQTIVSTYVNPPTKDVILDVHFANNGDKPDNTWYIGLMHDDMRLLNINLMSFQADILNDIFESQQLPRGANPEYLL